MRSLFLIPAMTLALSACHAQIIGTAQSLTTTKTASQQQSQEVTFKAADGETVYADLYWAAQSESQPFIILFHQAGANGRAEYAAITPKLTAQGYNVLQVDQRSGGSVFGSENRTVKARGGKTDYCAAYSDMEGALSYVQTLDSNGKIFAWGSSYSAALSLKLASEHGEDLTGVLSFSPATGSGMEACAANNFISDVDIPALGLRPESEMGAGGQAQKAKYLKHGLDYYTAIGGVHGSSMLDPARAENDVEPTWMAVWAFLDTHK